MKTNENKIKGFHFKKMSIFASHLASFIVSCNQIKKIAIPTATDWTSQNEPLFKPELKILASRSLVLIFWTRSLMLILGLARTLTLILRVEKNVNTRRSSRSASLRLDMFYSLDFLMSSGIEPIFLPLKVFQTDLLLRNAISESALYLQWKMIRAMLRFWLSFIQ